MVEVGVTMSICEQMQMGMGVNNQCLHVGTSVFPLLTC